ncbi:MAG: hypothetical protein J6Y30_12030 [Treponema sp.]|nr:hypothetical protein [Treponema sp.]
MVYRNKIEDEKKFLKNHYLTVGIPILIALPVFFFMFNFVFDSREDLTGEKWIMYFSLSLATAFVIAVMLISWRILKKNYEKYELEISESELISRTGKFQKTIKINELAKVDFSKRGRIFVYDIKGNLIIINDYLNGFEEIKKLLSSKEIPEENLRLLRKNKIAKIVKNPNFIICLIIILMVVLRIVSYCMSE